MNGRAFGSPAGIINPPNLVSLQNKSFTSRNFSPIAPTTSSNRKDIFRGLRASCSGNAERVPVQPVTTKSKKKKVSFSTEFLRRIIKTLPKKSNIEDVTGTGSDASPRCSGTLVKDTNAETNVGVSSETDYQWVDMLSAIFTGKSTLENVNNTGLDVSPRPGTLINETNTEKLSHAGLTDKSMSEDVTENTGSDASPRQETLVNETNSERPSSFATQSSKLGYHHQIIRYPVVTESALKAILECNTLVFVVDKDADKKSIKEAVTKMLKITIKKVNTLLTPEGTKKAYVMLKPGCNALDVAKKMNWL